MLNELAKNKQFWYDQNSKQTISRREWLVKFFKGKLYGKILDIGDINPMRDALAETYQVEIDSTGKSDLDVFQLRNYMKYDIILCLDVLEHLFNPLHCMLQIWQALKIDGKVYITLPMRGKLLWGKNHFHEIDVYRFRLLCKRAGFKIIDCAKYKIKREWKFYFRGIRPLLRLFFEYGIIYELRAIK